ncbi:MAG: hypothetical protein DRJ10_18180 [Bacteroidetes bacterium]|nr:MAG: hypothetical protein DRJ10_18180 [Bacteroidota bacterium]
MTLPSNHNDLNLKKAFEIILSIESFSDYINDIVELIYRDKISKANLEIILTEYGIENIVDIKEELLDLLIVYINLVLKDNVISENEKNNIDFLKLYFKIREGDFYNFRFDEIKDILNHQFTRLYADSFIDKNEALYSVDLQDLFDLSYDQFDEFKDKKVRSALESGANILNLDTAKYPKTSKKDFDNGNRHISQEVKDLVWNRDGGKCRECGSNINLEYDHIIPFSKGGANTYRNVQLLCQACNRKKSDKIG